MFSHPVTKREKTFCPQNGKFNSLLLTFCPSWTALKIINYPLKYTVEVLSAGMRPGGKGKLCDPATYKLLTPGLRPGRLTESSPKRPASNIAFGLCLCDLYTRYHSRCSLFPFILMHLWEGWRKGRGRDEGYWGWIVLVSKIKHKPPGLSSWLSLFLHYFAPLLSAHQRRERQWTSERHVDKRVLSGFELWAVGRCVCLTIW